MGDRTRGLYEKFTVIRNDGKSAEGEKHHGCRYFVLDLTHDRHALAALQAYIESCSKEYPLLRDDLIRLENECAFGQFVEREKERDDG